MIEGVFLAFILGLCTVLGFVIGLYNSFDWDENSMENLIQYTMLYSLTYIVIAIATLSVLTFLI